MCKSLREQTSICSPRRHRGFTLIEMAVVLVVVGLILSIGIGSWVALMKTREVGKTRSVLRQTKNCLLLHMAHNLYYPTFNGTNVLQTNEEQTTCINADTTKDVDACLCKPGHTDAWGHRIRYIAGEAEDGSVLNGQYAIDRPHLEGSSVNTNATNPDSSSNATLGDDRTQSRIGFIVLSLGADGEFDDSVNYDSCFANTNDLVGTLEECDTPPDFSNREDVQQDDQFLIVGGPEIRGRLSD